jgi:hypothetical protein
VNSGLFGHISNSNECIPTPTKFSPYFFNLLEALFQKNSSQQNTIAANNVKT